VKRPNLSPRDRRALLLGGALLVPALFFVLVVSPYLDALGTARERLEQDRAVLRRELALLSEAADYPRVFDEGAERLLTAAPRLMGGDDDAAAAAAVAGYVRRLGRMAPANVTRVEPAPSRDAGGGVTALPVAVSGEADLEGLLTLLHMLETGPKLVDVSELRIESSAVPAAGEAGGPAYSPTPFYTPGGAGVQPEVLTFRFTATGFTLAQPARRGAEGGEDQDPETETETEEDAG
jgi:hypothetical protein